MGPNQNKDGISQVGRLLFLSTTKQNRIPLQEIAVFIDGDTGLYLCNNGHWDIIDTQEEGGELTRLSSRGVTTSATRFAVCVYHLRKTPGPHVGQNSALRTNFPSSSIEYFVLCSSVWSISHYSSPPSSVDSSAAGSSAAGSSAAGSKLLGLQ